VALSYSGRWARASAIPRAISTNIGSYELLASSHNFARKSLTPIPMARAVVSAKLSLGPRSIPQPARGEATKSAGHWLGTTGAGNLGSVLSMRAIRDLSLWFISPLSQAATSSARHAKPGSVLDAPVRGDELNLEDQGPARGHRPRLQSFQSL
jgi:hypothetical protein